MLINDFIEFFDPQNIYLNLNLQGPPKRLRSPQINHLGKIVIHEIDLCVYCGTKDYLKCETSCCECRQFRCYLSYSLLETDYGYAYLCPTCETDGKYICGDRADTGQKILYKLK